MNYKKLFLYATITFVVIVTLFPIYWMFLTSVSPLEMVLTKNPQLLPKKLTLENYIDLFFNTPYLLYFKNSSIVAAGAILLTTVVSMLAGYTLTRFPIPQKKNFARLTLFTYMFPSIMLAVPYYLLFHRLGLLNSYVGLVVAHTARALPFGVWLMWQFFQTVPIEFEEAAWVYGTGRIRTIVTVALRLALPGAVAVAIFTFGVSWSDFTLASTLMPDKMYQTLPVGMSTFVQRMAIHWGLIQAGSALVVLPPLILVIFFQGYILKGFSARQQ